MDNKELKKKFFEVVDVMKIVLYVKLGILCYIEKEGFFVFVFLKQKVVFMLFVLGGEVVFFFGRLECKFWIVEKIEVLIDIFYLELYK